MSQTHTYRIPMLSLPERMRRGGGLAQPTSSTDERNPLRLEQRLQSVEYRVDYPPGEATDWGVYDPHHPAKDLIEHALMFRALYNVWGKTNLAVIEVELVDGGKAILVAESGGQAHLHSEQNLLNVLMGTELGQQVAKVTRMYTDLEPCDNGRGCNDCRSKLAGLLNGPDEHFCPERIYYSHEYDSGTQVTEKQDGVTVRRMEGQVKQDDAMADTNEKEFRPRADEFRQRAQEQIDKGDVVVVDVRAERNGTHETNATVAVFRS